MAAGEELEEELKGHTIHVGHGQDAYHLVAHSNVLADYRAGKVGIAPKRTVRQHHSLGEACSATGVVDKRQFFGTLLLVIGHMFLAEVLGILVTEHLVEMLTRVGQLVGTREHQRIVGEIDDALKSGHLGAIYLGGDDIAHEEQLGVAVVDNVVYLFGGKLVQDGYSYGTIGERGQEGTGPGRTVAATEGYLVTLLHTTVLKQNVQLLYLARHVMILQRYALVIGQCITVPMVDDALLNESIEAWNFHHNASY